jgi:hypothetical protein
VRHFALFAVLLQAASAVVERALELTWAATRGATGRHYLLSGFTGRGTVVAVFAVVTWVMPLLWTVAYFALAHDHRRLARRAALGAALPTVLP